MFTGEQESTLPAIEQWMLNYFINRFIPKSNNRRKYTHNEFSFVHRTISGIFLEYRRVNITPIDLLHCFARAGYSIYVRENPVGYKSQNSNCLKKSSNLITNSIDDMDGFIYIGISSAAITNLLKAVNSIAYQKNRSKIIFLTSLKEEIRDFFAWNHTVSP